MNLTFKTSHDSKKSNRFVFLTVIIFIFLWMMSLTSLFIPAFWQGLAVLDFCVALYYGVKFHMTEYVCTLTDKEFIIFKLMGKKSTKVCHLDNETVVELYTKQEWEKNKKDRQIVAVYNYNAHASPDEYYVVIFELDSKRSAVKFEASREMYDAFTSVIRGLKESQ